MPHGHIREAHAAADSRGHRDGGGHGETGSQREAAPEGEWGAALRRRARTRIRVRVRIRVRTGDRTVGRASRPREPSPEPFPGHAGTRNVYPNPRTVCTSRASPEASV